MSVKSLAGAVLWLMVAGGCGLLPTSRETMSSADKAKLNLQMGARYLDMGMLDVAREKLETAVRLDSSNAEIHNTLAVFYERIKDYDAADDSYRNAMRKDPESFSIKSNYGRFLCDRGKYDQAFELLNNSLESPMNNRPWFALTNLGLCHVKQNDFRQAETCFRQALQTQPDYAPALLEMQRISYQNQQFMSARAFMERYLGVAKHTPESLWLAFQTERALGNGKLAEEYREQLLGSFPASKEAQQVKTAISK
ncbi:type IV pilus biogenesis/stability protein PilW [Methylomonas sp. EFPC3]|uniref:type IV pilus biogenesis/stability protein PilW n=1 Tax=Methylomonas sp. EFPC3 TaxID=3021710 RepID=UPI0024172E87|nr:type IV pilus biogenesis/stability protein PilW [Methylomonas sp. EFPC3]WFP52038.1 type IV pilus biogenesis/stability protein PilW [Methylomonas sp. EFPC3]